MYTTLTIKEEFQVEDLEHLDVRAFSENGYPIFKMITSLSQIGKLGWEGPRYNNDIVIYSENSEIIEQLKKLSALNQNSQYDHIKDLKDFLKLHPEIILKSYTIKELNNPEFLAFRHLSDPDKYLETLSIFDYGICHLVKDNEVFIFVAPFKTFNLNVNTALINYYKEPVDTKDKLELNYSVVAKLYEEGKIKVDTILKGRVAQLCIDNIQETNKKLPTAYEFEQINILKEYASIEEYDISFYIDEQYQQKVKMNTHYGLIDITLAKQEHDMLFVSVAEGKKDIPFSLPKILMDFHYDHAKEKVNGLVNKFVR